MPDLTPALVGCDGYVTCVVACDQAGGMTACFDDCTAKVTPSGLGLANSYATCINDHCFANTDADTGAPSCTKTTLMSAECQACYAQVLSHGGACYADESACFADTP